ncbi:dockerin type I repeat-containing protein [Ammoniphilus sp. CFH 90114]|uniref:dockerin type I repeat-containing protein n=1 Tax=Ammoniphilus sp. CFH 90114 TaxID=2493665 RepID=UPI00100F6279|nr:dockerin type I repeat-containing protein [Ammoniphilus sp. CFH 90114]RXT04582.1 hypothetical protein EIZ39_20425 [Ammoniphilus sp. CFH 90114]
MKKTKLILSVTLVFIILLLPTFSSAVSLTIKGDGNGDGKITPTDSLLAKKFVLRQISLTAEQQEALDVNNDGQVTMEDVNLILDLYYGRIKDFPNHPPTLENQIGNQSAVEGTTPISLDLSLVFTDEDNNPLTYLAVSDQPTVASVQVNGAQLVVTPLSTGTAIVTVTVDDGKGGTATTSFSMTVETSNHEPQVTAMVIPHQVVGFGVTGNQLSLEGAFQDPDRDPLTYRVTASDTNLVQATINGSLLSLAPVVGGQGTSTVTVTADDGRGGTASINLSVSTVQVVHQKEIHTKGGVADVSYDLASYFQSGATLTVYTQTPGGMTHLGTELLQDKVFKKTPGSIGTTSYWVVAQDRTAAFIELVVQEQQGASAFFSEYVQGDGGKIALEMYNHGESSINYKIVGYRYNTKDKRMEVMNNRDILPQPHANVWQVYPRNVGIVINFTFYELMDITPVQGYHDELIMTADGSDGYVICAFELLKDGQVVDIIGDKNWSPNSTPPLLPDGGTIVRKKGIVKGSQTFSLQGEWDLYPKNSFQFLGSHTP